MNATDKQINGDHYSRGGIQPIEFIHANGMDFITGNIIKYATRWKFKGQALSDLQKVIHYAELLIELEGLDAKCETTDALRHSECQPTEGCSGDCDACELGWDEADDDSYAAWVAKTLNHPDASAYAQNYEKR